VIRGGENVTPSNKKRAGKGESMNMSEVRRRAIDVGIQPGRKPKEEIILEVQRAEGNTPCFNTSDGSCPHTDCCWLDDCISATDGSRR
jgi:hypothetical protein